MTVALRALLVAALVACASIAVDAGSMPQPQPVVYAVNVNGARVSDGALVLATADRAIFVRIDDLRSWRINVPAGLAAIARASARYVALRNVPGVTATFDAATQTLLLRVAQSALRGTDERLVSRAATAAARPAGAYANYTLATSGGSFGGSLAGEFETGIAALGGVLRNTTGWTPGTLTRLQTSWERDDPQRMRAVVIGDTTTIETKLGAALRFAGVRWSSDFTQQPQLSTYPEFTIRGAATVPSVLDIYINDVLALRRDVPAGPYTLRDVPLFDGAGTVAVRAADALGGLQQLRFPYYAARELLKPGLASFSYSAGFLDENGAYGSFFVDASRRWGITDTLTGGASAQLGAGHAIVGANADWLAGHAGVISLAAATSRAASGGGTLWDAGYDFGGRRLTLGADLKIASATYTSLDPTAVAIGREIGLHASLRITRAATAQISVARDATILGPVSIWTAGIAAGTNGIPYSLTAYSSAGAAANAFGLSCVWTLPIGRHATLSPYVGTGSNAAQSRLEYAGSASGPTSDLIWAAAAGLTRGATSTARLSGSTGVGDFDVDATAAPGLTAYTTRFSGGVAAIGGSIAATREITGSYGLVRVPGFAGVDVYVNDRYAGKTDARGNLVTADFVPFVENDVRIDPARLAASAHVDSLTRTVVPSAFGGTTVVFAAREASEVRLTVRTRAGVPLAPGTLVRLGDEATWPVGLDGHLDLIGISPGPLVLRAGSGPTACTFRVIVPAHARITQLADATCEPILPDAPDGASVLR